MLSLKPIMIKGLPGNETPYVLLVGVWSCISYQIDGRDNSRCGSLHKMGEPLCVLLPATTQLLLPLFRSGFEISATAMVSLLPKYNESAEAGATGIIPGLSKTVPLGIMGASESGICGYIFFNSSGVNMDLALVFARSFSVPDDSIFAIIFNKRAVRRLVHFSGLKFNSLYSSGNSLSFNEAM